jgi:hypothetical protein
MAIRSLASLKIVGDVAGGDIRGPDDASRAEPRPASRAPVRRRPSKKEEKGEAAERGAQRRPAPILRAQVDPVTVQIYDHLAQRLKERTSRLSAEEVRVMCERLSELEPNDARTARDLMRHHRVLYPSKEDRLVRNSHYPYAEIEDDGQDLKVYADKLPDKLLTILYEYVLQMADAEEEGQC